MNKLMKMKAMATKGMVALTAAMNTLMFTATTVSASDTTGQTEGTGNVFMQVAQPIVNLINSLFAPAMAIVVAAGTLYCVILGVKFAKAEEPQEHEKAKNHLKNAIIGFVLIFVLVVAIKLSVGPLTAWMMNPNSIQ